MVTKYRRQAQAERQVEEVRVCMYNGNTCVYMCIDWLLALPFPGWS